MKNILILIILIFFVSCSSFKKRKPPVELSNEIVQAQLKKVAQTLCFSGEGRARVFHEEKKYLVSYSSLLSNEKKQWGVGFELPMHGEETLTLNWEKWPNDVLVVAGSFYERIRAVDHSDFSQEFQANFWQQIFNFINLIEYLKNNLSTVTKVECKGQTDTIETFGTCHQELAKKITQNIEFKIAEDQAFFTLLLEEKWKLLIKVFWDRKWRPERLSFLVLESSAQNENASKMGMELFIKSCAVR